MKQTLKLLIISMFMTQFALGQCEITGELDANGIIYYKAEPVKVFWTTAKSLYCGAFTDDESYYLQFFPEPFPGKSKKSRALKDPATVTLANNEVYQLQFFDSRYLSDDSVFVMQFLIPDKVEQYFLDHEMTIVSLNLGDETGFREYRLKLHKNAIREQLKCLVERKK
jgi:hypothetical protein